MQALAIIPVRYQSQRLPGKPLRKIAGKSLIEWVFQSAKQVPSFSQVYLTTDSEEISQEAKSFTDKVVMTSSHPRCGTERVGEAAEKLSLTDEDVVINIQGDEPLISPDSLEKLTQFLLNSPDIEMATLAYLSQDKEDFFDPNIVKVVLSKDDYALYFSRSPIPAPKDAETPSFWKHLGIYGYRKGFLQIFNQLPPSPLEKRERLEQLRALENGYRIKVIVSEADSQAVNTAEDLRKVEQILRG